MRRIMTAIKRFFFPPAGSPRWVRLLPFVLMGLLTALVLAGGVYGWNYTNSPGFCGSSCHTMPPEYSAYLRSPHARVNCVECHIGRDIVTTQISRKAGDLRHVVLTVTQRYEFPIFTRAMRPARDSCERCHFPEKFSDDSLRQIHHYERDEANSPESTYLILKTGGGSSRQGLGRGIHWHIENQVRYIATDALEQEIPYVRTIDADGNVKEYYDIASGYAPDDVAGQTLQTMDCINCHNRVTHAIPFPGEAVDQALSKQLLAADLPFVRDRAEQLLSQPYASEAAADAAFATLAQFYADEYPEVAATRADDIQATIATLEDIYREIVFAEQKLDWTTHPDNLGHKDFPGCFRCHDGKHLTGSGEAIRLECNLCHAIPVVTDNEALVTSLDVVRGPEPTSHTHSSWITLHGRAIDRSCATCHPPVDATVDYTELTDKPAVDSSFCGNSACHASEWRFSGYDSPELAPILERQLYVLANTSPYLLEGVNWTYDATFGTMFEGRCAFCHGGAEPAGDLDLTTYAGLLHGGKSGPAVVPGDPAASPIIQRQSAATDHFGQVLDEELEALRSWIAAGAPEK